jgi:hypothetical protein
MLGNFFWRLTDQKQRVNKVHNAETDGPASSASEGKYSDTSANEDNSFRNHIR